MQIVKENRQRDPKISIIIPVYNGENFLAQAIDSALAQTYPDIEILVINDGSEDGDATERIALSYGSRIRYFKKPNGGVASALNVGVREMAGDYFSWLSHDDLYTEDKIACELSFLRHLPPAQRERTIVYSDYAIFTRDPTKSVPVTMTGGGGKSFRYWITAEACLHGCTLLIPRAAFDDCGTFDESLRTTQDYDLWFRMAGKYRFAHAGSILVLARSHADQGSVAMSELARRECNILYTQFVTKLSSDELRCGTGSDVLVGYAKIASSLWVRGLYGAAMRASRFAAAAFPQAPFSAMLIALKIVAVGVCMKAARTLVRRMLSAQVRSTIKHRMQRLYSSN